MKTTIIRNQALDTSREWLILTAVVGSLLLIVHAVANGWIGPWLGHNFYNAPESAWIGTYPWDPMHIWAGFSVGSLFLNFNWLKMLNLWSASRRVHVLVAVLATLVVVQIISLIWGFSEWYVYNRDPSSFIQTSLLDEIWDEIADFIGAGLAAVIEAKLF